MYSIWMANWPLLPSLQHLNCVKLVLLETSRQPKHCSSVPGFAAGGRGNKFVL